ncbi:MAG: sugar phosphate isomerase/epimerase family protein, partial [Anaerolineae bacterium]|nr:sugar phosphate isomerase/epimerase family protein [Anaerolineae bacterium]
MKLAIHEAMLPGRSLKERYQQAKNLGFDGIELFAEGLDERIMDVAMALDAVDLSVASVHLGKIEGYLSPDSLTREKAISNMRQAMAMAVDLNANHVVFVPQWGNLLTPDMTPYRSSEELASELLIWLLRTVSDLAYALGCLLHIQPRNRFETQFLNTVPQASKFLDVIQMKRETGKVDNPFIKIAPNTFDMALEEDNLIEALKQHGHRLGYLYLSDSNGRLPGQGLLDFATIASALKETNYEGWLCLRVNPLPKNPADEAYPLLDALPDTIELLEKRAYI